jgi:hypothetical protein
VRTTDMAKHLKIDSPALNTPEARTRLFKRRIIRKLKREIAMNRHAAREASTYSREAHLQ